MRPLIIAHRGASHLAPENTLTAFRLAKTLGADGFECDVQITRDRHLVVAHDYLTDLKTGVHGNIPDMDFDDLRQLDFGKWKSPEFAGEKIPTLEEVLEVAQDFRMIHIELKPYLDRDEEIVDRIIDAVLDAGLEEKAVLTSFEYGALRRVKERMPQMATCAMTLSPESQLNQPATFWEKLGLKKTDPLVEKLSSPQALSEAAALLEDPSSLDEENSVLIYYLKDRLDFLYSIFPGMNLAEILQQYYYQTDFVNYVAEQLREAGAIRSRKMFGEYGLYCDDVFFAVVCDDQLFVKATPQGEAAFPALPKAPPYEGARDYIWVEDVDDRDTMTVLTRLTCLALQEKPSKKRRK